MKLGARAKRDEKISGVVVGLICMSASPRSVKETGPSAAIDNRTIRFWISFLSPDDLKAFKQQNLSTPNKVGDWPRPQSVKRLNQLKEKTKTLGSSLSSGAAIVEQETKKIKSLNW